VCRQFVGGSRKLNLFSQVVVANGGSELEANNTHDKNFTLANLAKRNEPVDAGIAHDLCALEMAGDRNGTVQGYEVPTFVRISERLSRVLWTGHLPAISVTFSITIGPGSASNVIMRWKRSIMPPCPSTQLAQSSA
jgi:hypothetical protein